MAQLLLRQVSEGANATGIDIYYAGIFFGPDVPNGAFGFTEGGSEVLRVHVASGSTVAQINAAIRSAADAKAVAVSSDLGLVPGFTIATNGIFVPGFTKD